MFRISEKWRINNLLCLLICLHFLTGCNEVFEDDLTDRMMVISTPLDSIVTNGYVVTFNFELMNDAIDYKIQFVQPNFSAPEVFVVDTLITSPPFSISLNPGEYQWEMTARNNSSESITARRTIFIQEDSTIDGLPMTLQLPMSGYVTNDPMIEFRWDEFPSNVQYNLQFFENDGGSSGAAVSDFYSTTADSIWINVPEGNLFWRMNATDWGGQSDFAERNIIVDLTAPEDPTLNYPLDEMLAGDQYVTFSWDYGEDNLTTTVDSLLIFADITLLEQVYGIETIQNSHEIDLLNFNLGDHYWLIKTYDQAGNYSQSETGAFEIE